MDLKIKNWLGWAGMFALIVLSLSAARYVHSFARSSEGMSTFRSFAVNADAKRVAAPDIAEFTFSVINEGDKDLAALQTENTEKTNAAIDFLKKADIDSKDIKTQSYNVSPRSQYFGCPQDGGPCPPPEITGYTVTQTVSVKIRDFKKISEVLGGVVKSGANSVSQLSFTVDDPSKLQNEARAEAIDKARDQAKEIAKAGGFRLGKILSIDESGAYPPYPYYAEGMGGAPTMMDRKVEIAPAIEPGSQEIKVNISVRFEIE